MKLLFITQKIDKNDDILGVYHQWARGLADKFDQILIICLKKGVVELPQNCKVLSLGKESSSGKLAYLLNFFRYIWNFRRDYDRVFVHMNPEYMILGGWLWKILRKKVIFWYAHYLATVRLRIAALFADKIVTSTRLAYPLKNAKLEVLQQGIDTEKFKPAGGFSGKTPGNFKILFLGRIAPVKKIEVLIKAFEILSKKNSGITLTVVGNPGPYDKDYNQKIHDLVSKSGLKDKINFLAAVPNYKTPEIYNNHNLFINLTPTGSFDKSTLEAMASGLPAIVSNKTFKEIFPPDLSEKLMFAENDAEDLSKKIFHFIGLSEEEKVKIEKTMRGLIIQKHGLATLMDRLAATIKSL